MQIRAEANKYVPKRLKTGNLKHLSLLIVEILGVHVPPYCLTIGGKRTTEDKTKNTSSHMQAVERFLVE